MLTWIATRRWRKLELATYCKRGEGDIPAEVDIFHGSHAPIEKRRPDVDNEPVFQIVWTFEVRRVLIDRESVYTRMLAWFWNGRIQDLQLAHHRIDPTWPEIFEPPSHGIKTLVLVVILKV